MPKANLTLPDGTVVIVNGSAEEIAKIMSLYSSGSKISRGISEESIKPKNIAEKKRISKKEGPRSLIRELKDEDFFKQKRTVSDIQKQLEEKGHIYSQSSIAEPLLALVKKKELGRIKEKSGEKGQGKKKAIWCYVNR